MSAEPDEPAERDRWPTTTRARALLGVGAGAVAILGLVVGLGVADLTGPKNESVASGPATSRPEVPNPNGSAAPTTPPSTTVTTESTTTSTTSTTTSTSSSSTTTRPSTSSSATTTPATSAQTTAPTTAPPPAAIDVAYSQSGDGALVVPRNGSAIIQLTNTGGQQGQWSFSLPTPEYTLSQPSGVVAPGQTVTVTVRDVKNKAHSAAISAVVSPGTRLTIVLRTP